jgi:hypothetical protein
MTTPFEKYKTAEAFLKARVDSLGFHVTIEPVAGVDKYYSDGLAGNCHGKAVFTEKGSAHIQYTFFFPYYCMLDAPPQTLKQEFEAWLREV